MRRSRRSGAVQIAVAGGGVCDAGTARLARAVGREIALAGAILVCGGLRGVMAAASRGARGAGGLVVGLLPTYDRGSGNRNLSIEIPTGLGHARNVLVAASGDALIALPGEDGTRSEIALARVLSRPVVLLGRPHGEADGERASTPAAAVRLAIALARRARRRRRRRAPARAGAARARPSSRA